MKEKIYTIPLSEAYEEPSECPFCKIERKLEREAVEYALGASMMEPDSRILSNEKGFCRRHYAQMLKQQGKALSMALVLDTHLKELTERTENLLKNKKTGGFLKKATAKHEEIAAFLKQTESNCVICEKIENTLEKFACTFWELYAKEPDFNEKVSASQGFCLPHFSLLLRTAGKELHGTALERFTEELTQTELANLRRVNEEVHWFTQKFDYRYQEAPWKNSKDAPPRAAAKLAKFLELEEEA